MLRMQATQRYIVLYLWIIASKNLYVNFILPFFSFRAKIWHSVNICFSYTHLPNLDSDAKYMPKTNRKRSIMIMFVLNSFPLFRMKILQSFIKANCNRIKDWHHRISKLQTWKGFSLSNENDTRLWTTLFDQIFSIDIKNVQNRQFWSKI